MRNPRIHPGRGSVHADSMIDGLTMLTGTAPRESIEGLLAERLGEGVGVRPADARRPGTPGLDELITHPPFAQLLGLGRQGWSAGGSELAAGVGTEVGQAIGLPAGRLAVAAQPAGGGDLVAPAQPQVERTLRHQLLGGVAAAVAGDVARRHGDEVRRRAQLAKQCGDAGRSEEVDLDGRVERRVERHRCRRVDHDVTRRQHLLIVGATDRDRLARRRRGSW